MPDKKIIAVVGATGAQGGGLVRAIMNDKGGPFTARALTRDVNSPKAKALGTPSASRSSGITTPPRKKSPKPARWHRPPSTPASAT